MCQSIYLVPGRTGRRRSHNVEERALFDTFLPPSAEERFPGVQSIDQEHPTRYRLVRRTILSAEVRGAHCTSQPPRSNRVPLGMLQRLCSR